ncbi:TetR/AcrR family transcriptional regulator [Acinetobacter pittii]|uniref:TetR/AcrR family transcriptional regulator n=1 Tax=Acinetobacter pittii TaxID=48296 RepID=A0A6H0G0B2_ACIPI|nr:TetR/AcrR family transcriptional regulator [Acinetobacter pittii]QIT19999.1 TetR/AcrR family transcriptional regulator [Acinetobacter pittii]
MTEFKLEKISTGSNVKGVMSKKCVILNTAHSLFKSYGFNSVGVDRIIAESNVAKMTFYNNFGSKDNLIFACVEFEIESQKREILRAIEPLDEFTSREKLQAIYQWHIDHISKPDYNGCLLNKALIELWHLKHLISAIESFNTLKFDIVANLVKGTGAKTVLNFLNGIMQPANSYVLNMQEFDSLIDLYDK